MSPRRRLLSTGAVEAPLRKLERPIKKAGRSPALEKHAGDAVAGL